MPMSTSLDTYLAAARCLCHRRHMPMSFWRHAYVTLARCLCHHLRHAYVAEVRCLCRQSDIGISPAPHQKRPVYRCSGRPFFVLFGHFRHEMRIFPASEASFGADGGWLGQSANGWGGRRAHVVGGGRRTEASAICTQPPLFAHGLRSLYTGNFSSAGGFVPALLAAVASATKQESNHGSHFGGLQ